MSVIAGSPAVPERRSLPPHRWPASDQARWAAGTQAASPFDDTAGYAAGLRPATLLRTVKSYGQWLGHLTRLGQCDHAAAPLARATPGRVRAWTIDMLGRGNAVPTIIGRLSDLLRALRILQPGDSSPALVRAVASLCTALRPRARQRPMLVPGAAVLSAWGMRLMDEARHGPAGKPSAVTYRDGLIIAFLAARARRLHAMARLRVGHEVRRGERCYRLCLSAALIKNKLDDNVHLPEWLTPYIDHYLQVVRPVLTAGKPGDAFWFSMQNRPLSEKGLQEMVGRQSKAAFGVRFGPHRSRYAIATTAMLGAPDDPSLAARLLRISPAVTSAHYDRAGAVLAANKLEALVAGQRAAGRPQG